MSNFFLTHIHKNPIRSISLIGSIALLFLVVVGGIYIHKNVASAIEYYAWHENNEARITFASSKNLLNLFHTESGLSEETIQSLESDPLLTNVQVFRLVSIPVSAKFGFFTFALESDIPVFSVTDTALSGAQIPVGMSRTMIDLYNTQFAGSSAFFPQIRESFLRGQSIEFTFGKSKIFQSSHAIAEPITGKVTTISTDFPGLGLVLPESLVREQLESIGHSLSTPYKIVAYMKHPENRGQIESSYAHLNMVFEMDEIKETKRRISLIGTILFFIGMMMSSVFGMFFLLLLGGYFRERKDIFRMISLFGLNSLRSYTLTIGEPMLLGMIGIGIGILIAVGYIHFLHPNLVLFLESHGIFFPPFIFSIPSLGMIGCGIFCVMIVLTILFEQRMRKKYQYQ